MGAASAIEAITCALVVQNDVIPPTINYKTPDPECDLDYVPNVMRKQRVNIALNNAHAFGGNNSCLVVKSSQDKRRFVMEKRESLLPVFQLSRLSGQTRMFLEKFNRRCIGYKTCHPV